MGLDVPTLDDRTYEELLDRAKTLIPAYEADWTDFNPHDPGITILEVLAWLTETHSYQLDQVTDAHREKYLRLLGHDRRLQTAATAPLSIDPPDDAIGTRIPAETPLSVTDGAEETFRFETDHDVVLTGATVDHVVTVDATGETEHTEANRTSGMFYRPLGDEAGDGACLSLGFDGDPFADAPVLTLGVDYHDDDLPDPEPGASLATGSQFSPSVALSWAYLAPEAEYWESLTVTRDETGALYGGGVIELARRETPEPATVQGSSVTGTDPRAWIRCRVETPGYEFPPQVDAVRTNVVSASHRAHVVDETLRPVTVPGSGGTEETLGLDGQTYAFGAENLFSATVRVDGERFTEVPDFDASGPDDPHYVLDRERGRVTFGDGRAGRVPPADATVVASYVHGGGEAGTVSPSAVWRFVDPDTSHSSVSTLAGADDVVTPLDGASGGADSESIEAALRRARRDLRRPYRAVTAEDFSSIAGRTPGVRVARTTVLVDDPIPVVVVPFAPADVGRPEPSEGFLRAVQSHVDERTLLTDRVTVRGPRYVGLEVSVAGRTRPGFSPRTHETAVADAVESAVHPLSGGAGDGWPFGKTLSGARLADRLADLEAIDRITDLSITAHGGTMVDEETVAIDDAALFAVDSVRVDLRGSNGVS
ncbi:baseplate J/gp47 family protein [Halovivax cerinus]|uniref:Baseplate J/gp47 family protein n=1 Tax=Halovivax cerinus TaxID=1487865 RepID=A0ABD5NQK2_9EURY|nr:baseplate J/gp47 family protein [Halovivax cerinus]